MKKGGKWHLLSLYNLFYQCAASITNKGISRSPIWTPLVTYVSLCIKSRLVVGCSRVHLQPQRESEWGSSSLPQWLLAALQHLLGLDLTTDLTMDPTTDQIMALAPWGRDLLLTTRDMAPDLNTARDLITSQYTKMIRPHFHPLFNFQFNVKTN